MSEETKYCSSCGEQVDPDAVVCPDCGVQIGSMGNRPDNMSEGRLHELETTGNKSIPLAVILGATISPAAYAYIGDWKFAGVNILTLNYLLFGFFIVPFHVMWKMHKAEQELIEHNYRDQTTLDKFREELNFG